MDPAFVWLPATWDDVRAGSLIRRETGDENLVISAERETGAEGPRLRILLEKTTGEWKQLAADPTERIWIAVADPDV